MRPWPFFPIMAGLTAALIVSGCEGPTGPEGPAGAQGPTGAQGPEGPPGTANVISGSVTLEDADWSSSTAQTKLGTSPSGTSFSKPARYVDVEVSDITADVITDGAVLVYMQVAPSNDPTLYTQLPHRFLFLSGTVAWHFVTEVTEENIRVLFFLEDLEDPTSFGDPLGPTQPTRDYRWVIIPPAAMTPAQVQALPIEAGPDAVLDALADQGVELRRAN